MAWFKCFIHGENFPGILVGETKPIGFYVTRCVEAESHEEAELVAVKQLQNDKKLKLPENTTMPTDAKVYFEEITEVEKDEVPSTEIGFTFYLMDT